MNFLHLEISDTPSYTDTQTCKVNITVIQATEQLPPLSIPTFIFSFHELDRFPPRCQYQFGKYLLTMQPLMHHTTRRYLVDVIVNYALNLAYRRGQGMVSIGCVVEARLSIVHLRLADVEQGIYEVGGQEEVIMCPVCLEDLIPGIEFSKLPCSHKFHARCVECWCVTKKTCPYCRHKLEFEKVVKERLEELLRLNDTVGTMPST